MKLTGELKEKVFNADTMEDMRDVKDLKGFEIEDDMLESVSGGIIIHARPEFASFWCENMECRGHVYAPKSMRPGDIITIYRHKCGEKFYIDFKNKIVIDSEKRIYRKVEWK